MWNQNLAATFAQHHAAFMQEPTALGKQRTRFNSTFFQEWLKDNGTAKFAKAFAHQVEVWETASNRRQILGFVTSLLNCELCDLCSTYGRVTLKSRLCARCLATNEGQDYAQKQAAASVQKRWADNYDELMDKQRQTSRERYGTDYPWQSRKHNKAFLDKKAKTCRERYGHAHHLMNSEVFLRQAKAAYRIKQVVIDGILFNCQGYEPYVLPKLVKRFGAHDVISQFHESFVPICDENSYFAPDFYIKSRDTYVEVKSDWTLIADLKKNRIKAKLAQSLGKRVVWLVVARDKSHIKLPSDWHAWTKRKLTSALKR